MLAKLNKIKNWQAALVIAVIGFAVYFTGLTNPFQGDDYGQIVNSVPVHSITHIKLFFEGGTFYVGPGLAPLEGTYFRPLMTTTFSLIYTFFGAHPFYFHFVQLLLCIGSAIILYLFFRYSFKPPLALFLSLIFLVHPINSQVVFAIPSMQDALFFFFGILALYLLIRFRSTKSLGLVASCLMLSLLAKETAVLFFILALLYLLWWNKRRILPLIGWLLLPLALYIPLRIHAVGLLHNPYGGQIDKLSLASRLFTAPSIILFYIRMFLFPLKMATGYYWTYPRFSFSHFVVPLVIDLAVMSLILYGAYKIHKKSSKAQYYTYLFFMVWAAIGLGMLLQIQPLDLTASDIWFYFPMAGILGMLGVILTVLPLRFQPQYLLIVATLILVVLGVRTAIRGTDYKSPYRLSMMDISNSADNYRAYKIVAQDLINEGEYSEAEPYEVQAIKQFPQYGDFINMAAILINQHDYAGAFQMYKISFIFAGPGSIHESYDGEGSMTLLTGDGQSNKEFLLAALKKFPHDSLLWMYLAILEDRINNNADAKIDITYAQNYGQVPKSLYDNIMTGSSFSITLAGEKLIIP